MKVRVRTQASGGSRSLWYPDATKLEQRGSRLVISRSMGRATSIDLSAVVSVEIEGGLQ